MDSVRSNRQGSIKANINSLSYPNLWGEGNFLKLLFNLKNLKMSTKEEVLQNCTIEGNVIKLPPQQLERNLYMEVNKSLQLIGGKWKGGKVSGFVFPNDPIELLEQIANGEKRNLKKEYQFFATPAHLAKRLVELAELKETEMILEPSAGQGAIVNEILIGKKNTIVHCFELMDINCIFLNKIKHCVVLGNDFLTEPKYFMTFNKIVANPPFSKNQDIDHILKMYECLKDGGRIVTIASKHWQNANEKKCVSFREWLKEVDAEIIEIDANEFKESGTSIATVIIIINKP